MHLLLPFEPTYPVSGWCAAQRLLYDKPAPGWAFGLALRYLGTYRCREDDGPRVGHPALLLGLPHSPLLGLVIRLSALSISIWLSLLWPAGHRGLVLIPIFPIASTIRGTAELALAHTGPLSDLERHCQGA